MHMETDNSNKEVNPVPIPQAPPTTNPVSHQNRNLPIILVVILLFLLIGIGIYYLGSKNKQKSNVTSPTTTPSTIDSSSNPSQSDKIYDNIRIHYIDLFHVYLRQYYADNLMYPETLDKLIPQYATTVTTDPATKMQYVYTPSADLKSFTLQATLSTGEVYSGDTQYQQKIMKAYIQDDIAHIQSALELYRADKNTYPPSLSSLTPTYLKVIKKNPYSLEAYGYQIANGSYMITTELPDGTTCQGNIETSCF